MNYAHVLAVGLLSLASVSLACKKSDSGRTHRVAKANIAAFDPNADLQLDVDWGSERPDDYEVEQAFNHSFAAMDECVLHAKKRMGTRATAQLSGDIDVSVKLNPRASRPLGVNASLPDRYAKQTALGDCLREAVATAPFPTYDGPPVVVNFQTQLDPGSEWIEDDE